MNRDEAKRTADALLRAAGFRDVESGDQRAITDDRHGREPDPTVEDYYRAAHEQLDRFPWSRAVHREIWWRHCQGDRSRHIARALKLHRNTVNGVIARVREAMQARAWRRRGRPSSPDGHYRACFRLRLRLSDNEAAAAFHLAERWGCNVLTAVRRAVVVAANNCAIWGAPKGEK